MSCRAVSRRERRKNTGEEDFFDRGMCGNHDVMKKDHACRIVNQFIVIAGLAIMIENHDRVIEFHSQFIRSLPIEHDELHFMIDGLL